MQMQLKCHNGTTIILNEDEQAEVYEFYRLHQTMERLKEVLAEKEMLNTFKSEAALTTVAQRVLELKDDYHVSEDNAIDTVFEDTDYIETYLTKDMGEAISTKIQQALENDEDELDVYMEMLENGIDVEMVRKFVGDEAADHMQKFCEEHGLLDSENSEEIKTTYANLIRAMSDEELAEFLDIVEQDGIQSQCSDIPCECCTEKTECSKCWKIFLQSKVK